MELWIWVTALTWFTAAMGRPYWGLEKEALIVKCPKYRGPLDTVDWYNSKTNESIPTQKGNRVFASRDYLKFLPATVEDSGIYTCIIRSPTLNKTGHANVTIHKRQSDCHIPDYLMYSTISGSRKSSRISCPTIQFYNWTEPLEWFKNCKALQGPKYRIHKSSLFIDNAGQEDEGDYTCKFIHTEQGANYSVTATRSFVLKDKVGISWLPVIKTPAYNETKRVEIGETVNLTCSACFGRGIQSFSDILWQVNRTKVKDLGDSRFQEEKEQTRRLSSDGLSCLDTVLRISCVKEEDLSLLYDCVALNYDGVVRHPMRLTWKRPTGRPSVYYTGAGCSALLILTVVAVVILKVFWIEVALFWRDVVRSYKAKNDGKLYDAYVIYPRNFIGGPEGPSAVEHFVHQVLPAVLENKCGYNLCIYGRDLLPGEDMATAVETCIRKSRRHLFVLTPQGSSSTEFTYEQEVALHCTLIQNDSKVVLVEIQDPGQPELRQAGVLPSSLHHLVCTQGTIKWTEDHAANKLSLNSRFWKRVRYQMPVPSRPSRKVSGETLPSSPGHSKVPRAKLST